MQHKSTHNTSISSWTQALRDRRKYCSLIESLLSEEGQKGERLQRFAKDIGLPVYRTYRFLLPREYAAYERTCERISSSGWNLAIRFSSPDTNEAFYRRLDVPVGSAIQSARQSGHPRPFVATLTPYLEPEQSGTLIVKPGAATLEYVLGPHYWITKAPPDGVPLLRCELTFPCPSIRYSTEDPTLRALLFARFRDALRLTVGCGIRSLAEFRGSAYGEFHWRARSGIRFIDYSVSGVWTGEKTETSSAVRIVFASSYRNARLSQ